MTPNGPRGRPVLMVLAVGLTSACFGESTGVNRRGNVLFDAGDVAPSARVEYSGRLRIGSTNELRVYGVDFYSREDDMSSFAGYVLQPESPACTCTIITVGWIVGGPDGAAGVTCELPQGNLYGVECSYCPAGSSEPELDTVHIHHTPSGPPESGPLADCGPFETIELDILVE